MGMYCEVTAAAPQELDSYSAEPDFGSVPFGNTTTRTTVSLEKAWHGLHYLLTGEVWEGAGPLAFLLAGGETLGDDDESGLRWFSPEETARIHQALSVVTDDELWARFDADEMENQQIYPGIWDEAEQELKDEYLMYFRELKNVVQSAAEAGQGLLVSIG